MGKIVVAGLGPGSLKEMTPRVRQAIEKADIVVGYHTYLQLIDDLLQGKETIGTGMMQEIERCRLAVDAAKQDKAVVVVSSGDAGIYGMAGLILELLLQYDKASRPELEIMGGISAMNAAAAVLGAPLMHDFAVISLSNLLTPWNLISKRAECAAAGDFVIAIYNPKSKKRVHNIEMIQEVILRYRTPDTPVGIVSNVSRDGEKAIISTLADFTKEDINMFSLIIIGNSQSYVKDGYMITPRGYHI